MQISKQTLPVILNALHLQAHDLKKIIGPTPSPAQQVFVEELADVEKAIAELNSVREVA